ncbi:carboxypeptidase regulatory-like domain-containing protein [uncultured Treponema sp.]|uniref:carboxypeptidase regulatory-like domain-containing protein n=1 Tax=uncultured Treponema sp. TaxID=162155 RepID=UPI0025FB2E6B|nr:carboxypeptidase regulatory-like domain-containing protein [uncultured Treponema sp.]
MEKKLYNKLRAGLVILSFMSFFAACSQIDGDNKTGRYSIKGVVLDESNAAVSGVEISIKGISATATTKSDGSYELEGLGKVSATVQAKKLGYTFVPNFSALTAEAAYAGNVVNVGVSAKNGVVENVNFVAVKGDLKISDIQGDSAESPLKGEEVQGIKGVVTMICHRAPHFKYDTTDLDGETIPQWLSYDGFFMEALPDEKDLSGKKSNGIFVNTHDPRFDETEESHWKEGLPTDLQAGDVVIVNGTVEEVRHLDRFDSATGALSRTEINADAVVLKEKYNSASSYYPDGVLLTYTESYGQAWVAGHETDGKREYRVMPFDSESKTPMKEAIKVLESVEGMVVRIDNPLVVGSTYYNITGVLADGGKKGIDATSKPGTVTGGSYARTFNEKWSGDVIWERTDGVQDFNEELLFVDYQAVDWTTFYAISQNGDYLKDSNNERVFRGVMDYTVDGIFMARPLNNAASSYVTGEVYKTSSTPFYTRTDSTALKSVSGQTLPNQKWNFDTKDSWYYKADSGVGTSISNDGDAGVKKVSTTKSIPWRTGSGAASFDASELFTPGWKDKSSVDKGNTEHDSLTVAAFNIENYEAQGSSNDKQKNVAYVIKNNLLYPDVLIIVEMGDDKATPIHYDNQGNSWGEKDGVVTAVRNFSGIINDIKSFGGPQYDFRCVDHKEQDCGGKAGVNIRVGFLYNTERVKAVDSGLPNNNYLNTHGGSYSGALLDESEWPVQTSNHHAQGWALAEASTTAYKGTDGKVHLTQSPSHILAEPFNGSRRPIVQEFELLDSEGNDTGENFFVVGCHLGSKRGDFPLYGSVQPPLLLSENKRDRQARTVNEFVQSILNLDPNAKIVVGGDMNDFAYSTPQRILKGDNYGYDTKNQKQVLWSVVEELMPYVEQFSYTYRGNMQEIDHIFVSEALWKKVEPYALEDKTDKTNTAWKDYCFIPHINSMFSRNNHINLSDHDPDIIRIPGAFN